MSITETSTEDQTQSLPSWKSIEKHKSFLDLDYDGRKEVRGRFFDESVKRSKTLQGVGGDELANHRENWMSQEPEVLPISEDRGIFGDILSHGARGVNRAVSMVGGALQTLDGDPNDDKGFMDTIGSGLQYGADKAKHYELLRPDQGEMQQEGFVKRGIMSGLESTPSSLVPLASAWAGAEGGAAVGSFLGPVGTVVGGAVGGAVGGMVGLLGMFGLGTYYEENKTAKEHFLKTNPSMSMEEIEQKSHDYAWKQAAIETGGEFVGDVAGILLFGGGKALTQPLKATIRNLVTKSPAELAIQFGKDIPIEVATEMGQGAAQAYNSSKIGMKGQSPGEAAIESIIPAITMSLFMGSAISGVNQYQAHKLVKQVNSEDVGTRQHAIDRVADLIEQNTGDSVIANYWMDAAHAAIQAGEAIEFDNRVIDFASTKLQQEISENPDFEDPVAVRKNQALDIIRNNQHTTEELEAIKRVPGLLDVAGLNQEDIDGLIGEKAAEAVTLKDQLEAEPDKGPLVRAAIEGLNETEGTGDDVPLFAEPGEAGQVNPESRGSGALSKTYQELDAIAAKEDKALDGVLALASPEVLSQAESIAQSIVSQDPVIDQVDWIIKSGGLNKELAIAAWGEQNVKILDRKHQNLFADGGPLDVTTTSEKIGFNDTSLMMDSFLSSPSLKQETARIVQELEKESSDNLNKKQKEEHEAAKEKDQAGEDNGNQGDKGTKDQDGTDNSIEGIVSATVSNIGKIKGRKDYDRAVESMAKLPEEFEPHREKLQQAIDAKGKEFSKTAAKPSGVVVAVKDSHGTTHYLKQSDIDNQGRTVLPRYRKDGTRLTKDNGVHRDNLDPTGEKLKERWKELPLIDGKNGKGFKASAGVIRNIKKLGQDVSDFEIKEVDGRFIGVRKGGGEAKKQPSQVHDYSNTQIAIPGKAARKIRSLGRKIPDSELYIDNTDPSYGRDESPHVTVRYGLETDNPQDISGLSSLPPIVAKMGKVSIFEADQYDVVKVEIDGDSLRAANKRVGDLVDLPGETFKDYQPHATIAFVKKGEGKKYIGDTSLVGEEIRVDEIELTSRDGKTHKVKLEGAKSDQTREDKVKPSPSVEQEKVPDTGKSVTKEDTKPTYGQNNKLVSQERREELKKKLREKLKNLNSGFDPELFSLGSELAIFHIEAGAKKFVEYSKAMVDDVGEAIKPFLRQIYEGIRYTPDLDTSGMSPVDEITKNEKSDSGQNTKKNDTLESGGEKNDTIRTDSKAVPERKQPGRTGKVEDGGKTPGVPGGRSGSVRGSGADNNRTDEHKTSGGIRESGKGSEHGKDGGQGADKRRSRRIPQQPVNYHITDSDNLGSGGAAAKARANVKAIRIVKTLERENRPATAEEQSALVKYVGWGSSELANGIFPQKKWSQETRSYEVEYKKGWASVGKELEKFLTKEEYAAAKRSTLNAHYTSKEIIDGMYSALEQFGFKGNGRALEPGSGVGHFVGLIPEGMPDTRFTTVELDPISANIAQALYPGHDIKSTDYAKFKVPNNFFDIAIGNPPFDQTVITTDPDYSSNKFALHDFFFAKTIDKVRPGGLMMLVTSRYTMDKAGDKARAYLRKRADFLGAIRLPQTAFKKNAGTEVVTDVIFLQKREDGVRESGESWGKLKEVGAKDKNGKTHRFHINEYFANHPEMVIGNNSAEGSMYSANEYTVKPKRGDMGELFVEAVRNLPKDIYTEIGNQISEEDVANVEFAPDVVKESAFFLNKSGAIFQKEDGVGKPVRAAGNKKKVLTNYVKLRDAVRKVLHVQIVGKGSLKDAQNEMLKAYEDFVEVSGPINKATKVTRTLKDGTESVSYRYPNFQYFKADPDAYLVAAIEKYNIDKGIASKADIFTKRVISPEVEPKIESITDALHVTLYQTGRVDIPRIANAMDVSDQEAIDGLGSAIFYDPDGRRWVTDDEYLSGNVRQKLQNAKAAANIEDKFKRNIEALERVQPEDLPPSRITVALGMPIIDPAYVESFSQEVIDMNVNVSYLPLNGNWNIKAISGYQAAGATSDFGTARRGANKLLDDALNGRSVKIYDVDSDGKRIFNKTATEAATAKLQKIKDRFKSWVWENSERTDDLSRKFNDQYNNNVKREYGGDHIKVMTFPGLSSAITPYEHQKRVAWRVVQKGNTYMAHSVGAGKTIGSIIAGMEQKRLGIKKKPMWVVPNHMLKQFSAEFLELYPAAKLLVADEDRFSAKNRNRFMGSVATENWDGIIITHSAFMKIPMSPSYQESFIQNLLDEVEEVMSEVDGDYAKTKQVERQKKRLEQRLEKILAAKDKDNGVSFEETGIDQLFVDEAQEYRKLDFVTNQTNVSGIDSNGSMKAFDLYSKIRFLESLSPGRSTVLMSGTPITNTIGEVYTIQRYLQEDKLHELGLHHFDNWSATFGDMVTNLEATPAGTYKPVTRFARFTNMQPLVSMWADIGDAVHAKDLHYLTRPTVAGGGRKLVVGESSDIQQDYKKQLAARISAIESRNRPPKKGDDIILSVITDGRHAAMDDRFIDSMAPNRPDSKMEKMLENVFSTWDDTKSDRSTQMIFADLGMPGAAAKRGFSVYTHIKEELIKRGVPENEIAFMQDYKKSDQKMKLFKALNNGDVRVLVGSSIAMGTGVNAQKRLVALHHFDPDTYLPANIERREGRIVRQGNTNKEVHLYAYVTRGSYDETMWQFLETKQRFIDQFLAGDVSEDSVTDIDGSADSFAEARSLSSDNPLVLEMAGVENELSRLESLYFGHLDDQRNLSIAKGRAEVDIEASKKRIIEIETALKSRVATKGKKFSMVVDGKTYADRGKAGTAFILKLKDLIEGKIKYHERTKIAEVGGYSIMGTEKTIIGVARAFVSIVDKPSGYIVADLHSVSFDELSQSSPSGLVMKYENSIRKLSNKLEYHEESIARNEKTLSDAEERIGQPFENMQFLEEKRKRLEEIKEELEKEGTATPESEEDISVSGDIDTSTKGDAVETGTYQADGEVKYSRKNKSPWPEDLPNVKTHTTLTKLRSHQDYKAAKSGDVESAIRLVTDLAKPEINKRLFSKFPNAIIVTPHAIEETGENAIPRVLAENLGDAGFQVDTEIVQSSRAQRTKKKAALRLAVLPEFDGDVENGRDYIIVDDVVGAGGTINELRYHIEKNGGKVVFVTTLTQGMYAAKLSVRLETIQKLEAKHGRTATEEFIRDHNTAGTLEALTEKQARTILKSVSLDSLRNRILTQAREADISPSVWEIRPPLQVAQDTDVKFSTKDQSAVKLKATGEATDDRSKEDIGRLQRNVEQDQHGRQDTGRNGEDRGSRISFTPVTVSPELTKNTRRLAKLFGKRVVFFRANNNLSDRFNGATLPKTNPDVIYININNEYLPYTVLGHELGHLLREESPRLYEQLKAVLLSPNIINSDELIRYRDKYNLHLSSDGLSIASDSYITEEFISDFLGDNFTNETFWKLFSEKDHSLFRKVIRKALDFLNNVLKHFSSTTSLQSNLFFKDVEKARDAIAWTMSQYSKERGTVTKKPIPLNAQMIRSENFKKWFGNSMAVNKKGIPAVLYHGSPQIFHEFLDKSGETTNHTSSGLGSFFTPSKRVANKYAKGGAVIDAYLRVEKPYRMTLEESQSFKTVQESIDRRKELEAKGYDSVIISVKGSPSASQIVVFDGGQIKSATENTGDFSTKKNDIRYSAKVAEFEKQFKEDQNDIVELLSDRTDSSSLERIFSTFEYIAQKHGATKKMLQAHLDRRDDKYKNEERILGDFVPYMEKLRKENSADYKEANSYLLKIDRSGKGYRIKRETSYKVSTPEGETVGFAGTKIEAYALSQKEHGKRKEFYKLTGQVFKNPETGKRYLITDFEVSESKVETFTVVSPKNKEVGIYEDETEAVDKMISSEGIAMKAKGSYSDTVISAVARFREMTNRAMDEMVADLRSILEDVRAQGLDEPTVNMVDESRRWAVRKKGNAETLGDFATEDDAKDAVALLQKSGTDYSRLKVVRQEDGDIRKEMGLSEIMSMMGDLRGVYFPRQRNPGGVILRATMGDEKIMKKYDLYMTGKKYIDSETGVEQKRPMSNWLKKKFNQATGFIPYMETLEKEARKLKREGYDVSIDRDKSMPESIFEPAQLITTLDALMNDSLAHSKKEGRGRSEEFVKQVNDILTANIAKIFQTRGYLSSRAKRTEDYWSGFEEDMMLAGTMYARGLSAGFAKRDAARKMTLALSGRDIPFAEWKEGNEEGTYEEYLEFVDKRRVDPTDQKHLYTEAINWMREVLRNEEQTDRIMGTIKGLAVLKFLGFRVSSAVINMTNMVQAVPATISSHTGGSLTQALNQVRRSATEYTKHRTGKGKLSAESRDAFQYITDNGWDDAQFNTENASVLMSKLGRKWNAFAGMGMMAFGAAEKVNRAVTIHAAYMQFRENTELSKPEALAAAKHASDRAHGVYGKGTAPAWTRGAANPLKLTYTFQKFMHNYVLNMIEMGFKGDHKQAAYMLVSPAILAGAGASVLTPLLAALFPGDDPEEEFYKWAEETFGTDSFARHGLFGGLLGVNFKGSLQMNNPFPTRISEVFGAPQSVIGDVFKGVDHASKGEFMKSAEKLLPTGFGSMIKSAREYNEGVTTSSYSPVFYGEEPLKGDSLDAFLRFFSFNPSRLSGIREKQWNEKKVARKYQERRTRINSMIKHEMVRNDGKVSSIAWAEIMKEVSRYNDLVLGSGREDIRPITRKSIKRLIRGTRRAPRRERLRRMAN